MPRSLPRLILGTAATLLVVLSATATTAVTAAAVDNPVTVPASAASQVAWSMVPVITNIGEERSNFAYALQPGAIVEDAVLVRNSGDAVLDLAVFGSDAVTDGSSGALDIATTATGSATIGTWITPSVESVHIEPGEVAHIPFSVTIPADAQPGEHAGALLTALQSGGDTVSVDMRYATRVTVTVAGELTAGMTLDQAQLDVATGFWPWEPSAAQVSYVVGNTGNTRLTALQLITAPGVELYSSSDASTGLITLAELLPVSAVDVQATVQGLSAWLPITAVQVAVSPTVIATPSDGAPTITQQQLTLSTVAIAPGWWVLLAGFALVVAAGSRMRPKTSPTPPSPQRARSHPLV